MNEIVVKAAKIDEMASRLETMLVHELMMRVEVLEDKATTTGGFERRDSSTSSVTRMEERIKGLDKTQQAIVLDGLINV